MENEKRRKRVEAAEKTAEGRGLLRAGKYEEAIRLFDEAIAIDPDFARPRGYREEAQRKLSGEAKGVPPEAQVMKSEEAAVPVKLTIEYPERLSRLLLFFKWLLVIPPAIVAGFWGIAAFVVVTIGFFAILFVGRFPRGLFDFVVGYNRFVWRVYAYFPYLLVDHWWPDEYHPLGYEVEYAERLSRGVALVKLLALVLGAILSLINVATTVIFVFAIPAWFIILFTGRYPRGMYNVVVMLFQWVARVTSWQYLLRDEWSLFGTTRTVKIWVLVGVIGSVVLGVLNYVVTFAGSPY